MRCELFFRMRARAITAKKRGTMPTYSEFPLKGLRPQYLWVVVFVSKATNSGMTRANISSGWSDQDEANA